MSQLEFLESPVSAAKSELCYHCNDKISNAFYIDDKAFCCNGCQAVYELLSNSGLNNYYHLAQNPGLRIGQNFSTASFDHLDIESIRKNILAFASENIEKVRFHLPAIHCIACVWLLENLPRILPGVVQSRVNFLKREVYITYQPKGLKLSVLAATLTRIGYEPEINLQSLDRKKKVRKNTLIYQIGVAGFCFGNIMLLSFPEYLSGEPLDERYRLFFGKVNFVLALPVLLFSGRDYLLSAWRSLKMKAINIDVPIALGIIAMFSRSTYEIIAEGGGGYMDSLAALILFLLIGKWIQQRTYSELSFERDYQSYFPIAVQRIREDIEEAISLTDLKAGERFAVRSGELIPVDATLLRGEARVDYSFVSGETDPIFVAEGEKIFAGGRQTAGRLELEALSGVNQSYLTALWNDEKHAREPHQLATLADRVGKRFTIAVLLVAALAGAYWSIFDPSKVLNAVSAILIIACPCALALSFPFAFGNSLRYLGRQGFYVKDASAVARMAEITQIVFDKTGTLTRKAAKNIALRDGHYTEKDLEIIAAMARQSAHPLSRHISEFLSRFSRDMALVNYREVPGKGIEASCAGVEYKLGSSAFINQSADEGGSVAESRVCFSRNSVLIGCFAISKSYHEGLSALMKALKNRFGLSLISGDRASDRAFLERLFEQEKNIHFEMSPSDKQEYIRNLKKRSHGVAMVGDGLNDAGALMESDFGISVADDIFRFTPASDAILSSHRLADLGRYFDYARHSLTIVKLSLAISISYNVVGVFIASQGLMKPVYAAILMPLSSVTVVVFVTLATAIASRRIFRVNEIPDKYHIWP